MDDRPSRSATLIGYVASVAGAVVRVRLQQAPTTLVMVAGESYRIGQIGAFLRIPLGYTSLFGVCTQVGADAAPTDMPEPTALEARDGPAQSGFRWMTLALFGEALGGQFDRGVGQYPTVGDEVHLVTPNDVAVIYGDTAKADSISVGRIATATGVEARLQLSTLVSRHCSIVGSTGSGKSNLVAVILEELAAGAFPRSRVLVIDPHGEYGSSLGPSGRVITSGLGLPPDANRLRVPFWALPLDELIDMTMGDLQPHVLEAMRDRVRQLKTEASTRLKEPPPVEAITADSPIPFSIRRLWFELQDEEAATYKDGSKQDESTRYEPEDPGDAATLRPTRYPPATTFNSAPYYNKKRRGIGRQLDLLRSRLLDARFAFMFDPDELNPDLDGAITSDLSELLADWVGGDEAITVLDVSSVPSDVLTTVVGTMLRLIYDALFWAMNLDVGGRRQPLLIVLDEAHRFLAKGVDSPSHRTIGRIAKEGRKYGVGLMIVSQRPGDVDGSIMSQCGTMIALRVTNGEDRSAVAGSVQDDLAGLTGLIPSLRTGEALVLGDALHVPSRIRIRKALHKPVGQDPDLPSAWVDGTRPSREGYEVAIRNWRSQSTAVAQPKREETQGGNAHDDDS